LSIQEVPDLIQELCSGNERRKTASVKVRSSRVEKRRGGRLTAIEISDFIEKRSESLDFEFELSSLVVDGLFGGDEGGAGF